MKVVLDHNLPQERAIICAEKIFKDLSEKYEDEFSDLEQKTEGNEILFSFRIRGMNISGTITVNEDNVTIEGKLPFAAKIFKGLIENKIRENADDKIAEC